MRGSPIFDDGTLKFRRRINDNFFKWFELHAPLFTSDNVRLGDLELVTLATHILEQDGDVELATPRHTEQFCTPEIDLETDVDLKLFLKAVANLAAGDVLPSFPAKGELLTRKLSAIVGSSTAIAGNGDACSLVVTVSPI